MSTIALRGPERVVIRQHRWTLWTVGVLTLAGIAAVVAAYLWMASASDTFANSGCSVENTVRGAVTPSGTSSTPNSVSAAPSITRTW